MPCPQRPFFVTWNLGSMTQMKVYPENHTIDDVIAEASIKAMRLGEDIYVFKCVAKVTPVNEPSAIVSMTED